MLQVLSEVRKKVVIGFVGGSDLKKIEEQLSVLGHKGLSSSNASILAIKLTLVLPV